MVRIAANKWDSLPVSVRLQRCSPFCPVLLIIHVDRISRFHGHRIASRLFEDEVAFFHRIRTNVDQCASSRNENEQL